MQGTGNDYIYIDCIENKFTLENIDILSQKLSDRHFGIGADGIVLIFKSNIADFKMRMFNSDGSEGNMCGNAIRCIGKYVYDKGYIKNTDIKIETLSGIKNLHINHIKDKITYVEVDMGFPIFNPKLIPVNIDKKVIINEPILIDNESYNITCLSVGNPHCIIFVNDLENLDIQKLGPKFENDILFPNRVNTEFVKVLSRNNINMRVWERGSGETLSCGTGACAATIASILNGYCDYDNNILVNLLGGNLTIKYEKDGRVFLNGPAEHVFKGTIDI